ncbi:Multifunctional non-homologous end joining DNA repair protein LigD [bacterium HR36]|nr:Multifunctional non-homologous end joining DNA repair protein LigD [bacterium HR36]
MAENARAPDAKESTGRFVLLYHTWPQPHYDLMLEWQGVLKTWRLPIIPEPGLSLTMESLGDHRLAYLDYEGPVSGNRGEVKRIDRGTYSGDLSDLTQPLRVHINGALIRGWCELRPLEGSSWQWRWLTIRESTIPPQSGPQ